MKINALIALSLTVSSSAALAFQVRHAPTITTVKQVRTIENNIINSYYYGHLGNPNQLIGSCASSPIAGCNCPYCTMLRGQLNQ